MRIYGSGGSLKIISPYAVEQLLSAENLAWIRHEKVKKLILLVGQRDLLSQKKNFM